MGEPQASVAPRSYELFLQEGIRRFWRSGVSTRMDLIALLLAGRESWTVAWGEASSHRTDLIKGAAGVAGATLVLRSLPTGPLGLVLAGVSVGSLGALYARHHERIWGQVERYRALVEEYRPKYEAVAEDTQLSAEQVDLMLEGLSSRFVQRLESLPHVADQD